MVPPPPPGSGRRFDGLCGAGGGDRGQAVNAGQQLDLAGGRQELAPAGRRGKGAVAVGLTVRAGDAHGAACRQDGQPAGAGSHGAAIRCRAWLSVALAVRSVSSPRPTVNAGARSSVSRTGRPSTTTASAVMPTVAGTGSGVIVRDDLTMASAGLAPAEAHEVLSGIQRVCQRSDTGSGRAIGSGVRQPVLR
jgi:hypothetical protein